MAQYAKDQPAGFINAIERIAIVGAGGTIGTHLLSALHATGKHTITALSRTPSSSTSTTLPPGVHHAQIDYADESTLISALRNQQFLIITLSPTAPRDTHSKLVRAAAKAGVPYIMPNSYAGDIHHVSLGTETMMGPPAAAARKEIEELGMQWVAVCCGFWYEYSLAGGEARLGFDFANRAVTIYDDGTTKVSFSSLTQVGRAVATLLSLKLFPEDESDEDLTVSKWLNKPLYVTSFVASQNEILESVLRVTGTEAAEWSVSHEASKKRYEEGLALVKKGNMAGFSRLLYARAFYPEDPGDCSAKAQNGLLGLPEERLDEFTKVGIEMVQELQKRPERMAH
ncbi:hypothetical protein BJX70DRAFT_355888 [Aspergillus crustosus]